MSQNNQGIGWKAPVDIELSNKTTVKVMGFIPPPAYFCLRQCIGADKKFDEAKLTPDIISYFLKMVVIEPKITEETFQNSDFLLLMELVGKIVSRFEMSPETAKSLKELPPKP